MLGQSIHTRKVKEPEGNISMRYPNQLIGKEILDEIQHRLIRMEVA